MLDEKYIDIIDQTHSLFMRYGVRSLNMDDISRELKMSKKTLYKYVQDKPDLVCKVMQSHIERDKALVTQAIAKSDNAIDAVLNITEVADQLMDIHPSVLYDLDKYYPDARQLIHNYQTRFIENMIADNLKQGIEEGLYRKNLDAQLVAHLFARNFDVFFDSSYPISNAEEFREVHLEIIRYHIRGVASVTGIAYLEQKIKENQLNL